MASRTEILSATKSRADKKSTLARNGRWNTSSSGAFLRAPQVTRGPGSAGSGEQAKANFFKAIVEDVIPQAKKFKDEKDKEQVNFGKASWTKASKEQRERWAYAIKHGHAFEGDSPYFRQGVMIAHTESLASKYSQEMFQRYEAWEKKNDPKSGTFDDWLNEEDQTFQRDFENIDDEVLNNHFLPMQAQVRSNLRTRHTQRLNENYRTESYYTKQNAIFGKLRDFFGPVYEEGTAGMNFNDLIIRGGEANQQSLETITTLQGIFEKPNPTKADFMKVPNGQAMWDRYSKLSGKKSDMLEDKDAVSVKDDFIDVVVPGEIQGEVPDDKIVPLGKGKGFLSIIEEANPTMFAKMSPQERKEATFWLENYNKKRNKDLKPGDPIKWNWQQYIRWREDKKSTEKRNRSEGK